ncbi:biotin carboxyl carrier domain-containing protein [Lichenihabitans sp. PAMC28606]|uniref:acetyl-CoA carboxylase n=1 Tax=Lichenihabitans sp. PAMC28606 TaxID=2880932 RepID=UPI001D09F2E7|nr:acetyl-CoA carboxylase [Lichenihabitans sp. PAMC28606]UDL93915.1 biotin carboxyl carrier domain-containing protein [Lichenihabitans sp. PAMC28606]
MAITTVPCPLPGTFYRRPSPDQPPFKTEGDTVAVGDTIGLVEVMKSFTTITAEIAGVVAKFHVDDEDPVMAGEPLFDIEA